MRAPRPACRDLDDGTTSAPVTIGYALDGIDAPIPGRLPRATLVELATSKVLGSITA